MKIENWKMEFRFLKLYFCCVRHFGVCLFHFPRCSMKWMFGKTENQHLFLPQPWLVWEGTGSRALICWAEIKTYETKINFYISWHFICLLSGYDARFTGRNRLLYRFMGFTGMLGFISVCSGCVCKCLWSTEGQNAANVSCVSYQANTWEMTTWRLLAGASLCVNAEYFSRVDVCALSTHSYSRLLVWQGAGQASATSQSDVSWGGSWSPPPLRRPQVRIKTKTLLASFNYPFYSHRKIEKATPKHQFWVSHQYKKNLRRLSFIF